VSASDLVVGQRRLLAVGQLLGLVEGVEELADRGGRLVERDAVARQPDEPTEPGVGFLGRPEGLAGASPVDHQLGAVG